ncbi:MAG: GTPase [Nanoarchaeota archaeon]|nr:GTPase [Nanoarchaeota archaeon]
MGYWPVVLNVLKNSDVVILIADARVPEITKNKEIIKKAEALNKKLILVFNKTDLVGKRDMRELKKFYPESFFITNKNKKTIIDLRNYLEKIAENHSRTSLRIGVVGYPNAGKSTLINMLVPGANVKVANFAGTTKKTEWLRLGRLRIMDSPGVIPTGDSSEVVGVASAKDPHKIKNPERIAIRIISFLNKKNKKILEKFYNVNADDDYELFLEIGRVKKYLTKGGEVDEFRTAIKIVEDWQGGKIGVR